MSELNFPTNIDIIGRSQAVGREAFLALEREVNKVGLKINESNTKYIIAARNDRTICDVG
jgi:5,10-methylene-tetrahydrofolate dehydrogenase/methenyl tetrahydrofolate cyclohydrolase